VIALNQWLASPTTGTRLVLGPVLFNILTDSLLRIVKSPTLAFADDLKLIACTSAFTHQDVQNDINTVVNWAEQHNMPLSDDKCNVLHCGKHQMNRAYTLKDKPLAKTTTIIDLGVIRSSEFISTEQCMKLATKAARAAFLIRRSFGFGSRELLWPAFQAYVLPILMYCASSWSPSHQYNCNIIEKVQQRYTKSIRGLHDLPYNERLRELRALTLRNRRVYADMTFIFKCLHGYINCEPSSFGLHTTSRSNRPRLTQKLIKNKAHGSTFSCRGPSTWNKLPPDITCCQSLNVFKRKLFNHLIGTQL
jgi:hypothetical protein